MVWFSNSTSLAKNEVSFLAIIEIIFAIALYWGVAIYSNIYWHLILSILTVPFLLLQSKQSIEFSLKKFNDYNHIISNKIVFGGVFIALPLLSLLYIVYFQLNYITFFSIITLLLFIIFILGTLIVIRTVKVKEKLEFSLMLTAPYFSFIKMIIYIVNSITAKVIGTVLNLHYGYINFTSNWFRRTFVIDIISIAEIITGIEKDKINKNNSFSIAKKWQYIKLKKEVYDELDKESDISMMWALKISSIIELIGIYLITSFYRLSIKSTFWFYLPLLFVVKKPNLNTSQNIGKFLSELYQTIWVKIRVILAFITLVAFVVTHFNFYSFENINSPFSSLLFLLYLNFSSIEIWRIFQLTVALLTIGLFFYANAIRVPNVSNNIPLENDIHIKIIFYLNSIRNWFSLFYLISAFIFLAIHFKVWEYEYVPNFFNNFFSILLEYIRYVPFN